MKRTLIFATFIGGLTSGTAATAHPGFPGHRHVAVVPAPHGAARPATPYCATYGCSGSATTTGPQGNTVSRSGNASCADGTCTRSRSVTGPNGETRTFDRSFSR